MYTDQIKRRKSNAYYEMKTMGSAGQQDKIIEKLGSSIYASMDHLQSLKAEIMSAHMKDLKPLMAQFQREHASFMDKQKSLMEIEESSDKIDRLKNKVREFLQVFTPDEIERKLERMKEEHLQDSEFNVDKQDQMQVQMQKNKYEGESLRKRMLDEEDQQLKQIESLMEQVKKIAIDTSQLIVGVGAKLNMASESIKAARLKMQAAKKELEETNKYEENTTKTKIWFGALICVVLLVILLVMVAANKN